MPFLEGPLKFETKSLKYRQEVVVRHAYYGSDPCPYVKWRMPEATVKQLQRSNIQFKCHSGRLILGSEAKEEHGLPIEVELEVVAPHFWLITTLNDSGRPSLYEVPPGFEPEEVGKTIGRLRLNPTHGQEIRILLSAQNRHVEYHLMEQRPELGNLTGTYRGRPFTDRDEIQWDCTLEDGCYRIRSAEPIELRRPQQPNFELTRVANGQTLSLPVPDMTSRKTQIINDRLVIKLDRLRYRNN